MGRDPVEQEAEPEVELLIARAAGRLRETNLAAAMARGMDTSALYGTGATSPAGLFTSAYSGTLQTVSMDTNVAAPTNYDQISQGIEKVRVANDNPTGLYTNPQVHGTYSRLKNTQNDAMRPGSDVLTYWPPSYSTAFTATETQGTSNVCSSVLCANANRIILGMRVGLVISQLDQRYADSLQIGFVGYLRRSGAIQGDHNTSEPRRLRARSRGFVTV